MLFMDETKVLSVQEAIKDVYVITKFIDGYRKNGRIKSEYEVTKRDDEFGWNKVSSCKADMQRISILQNLMDKYHYGWYIPKESITEQLKSLVDFQSYILSHIGERVVFLD